MRNHLRRKLNGLKRKLNQSAPIAQIKRVGLSRSDAHKHNITVANIINFAAVVNTWQTDSSQMVFSNQATHINQENF